MKTHLEHTCKFLSVRQKCLPMENMHEVIREFELILLEKETGKNCNKVRINIAAKSQSGWNSLLATFKIYFDMCHLTNPILQLVFLNYLCIINLFTI